MQKTFKASDVSGFDFSNVAIAQALEQGDGIVFFNHNIYDSLHGQYDVIVCMELLEHLTTPETAVRNLLSCLSNGGVLFLTVPDGRVDRHVTHINFWSPESWEFFIRRLGQEAYDVSVGIVQHPSVKAKRYNWAILKQKDTAKASDKNG